MKVVNAPLLLEKALIELSAYGDPRQPQYHTPRAITRHIFWIVSRLLIRFTDR